MNGRARSTRLPLVMLTAASHNPGVLRAGGRVGFWRRDRWNLVSISDSVFGNGEEGNVDAVEAYADPFSDYPTNGLVFPGEPPMP